MIFEERFLSSQGIHSQTLGKNYWAIRNNWLVENRVLVNKYKRNKSIRVLYRVLTKFNNIESKERNLRQTWRVKGRPKISWELVLFNRKHYSIIFITLIKRKTLKVALWASWRVARKTRCFLPIKTVLRARLTCKVIQFHYLIETNKWAPTKKLMFQIWIFKKIPRSNTTSKLIKGNPKTRSRCQSPNREM